jgi:SAM-dependent methyltransferase
MVEEIIIEECPDCGGKEYLTLYRDSRYSLRECRNCLAMYNTPRTFRDFQDAFSEQYYRSNYLPRQAESIDYYRRQALPMLRPLLPEGARILDIGCGTGFFLKAAKDAGYRVTGVEPSSFASGYCRSEFGIECHTGFFEDVALEGFDLICLLNVFSHLTTDRTALLKKVAASLKPGGKLLIKTCCWSRYYPILTNLVPNEGVARGFLHLPLQFYTYHSGNIGSAVASGGFKVELIRKCFGEWSILKAMDFSRKKSAVALILKWLLLKATSGPFKTDMWVVAGKKD